VGRDSGRVTDQLPTTFIVTTGCIDANGHVIGADGYALACGTIWIRRTELQEAIAAGWRLTDLESGQLVAVTR
jgi:hypothetical protein